MRAVGNLAKEIRKCRKCPLWKKRKHAVPGEGPANAKILLVGEAPGENEDLEGRPFVGRAGELLSEILKRAGIDRKKIFITNVVKCRPPGNRKPKKEEIEKCIPYLREQITLIDPRIIVPLGETALANLISKKLRLSEAHGKFILKDSRVFLPTYHPASIRYDLRIKEKMIRDLKKIKGVRKWNFLRFLRKGILFGDLRRKK